MSQAKSVDSLRTASEGSTQGLRGKMKPLQEATESKLAAVFNDEQKKQYAALQEERKARMQQARKKKEK